MKKIIEILKRVLQYHGDEYRAKDIEKYCESLAKEILDSLWTDVRVGLPENGKRVLVYSEQYGRNEEMFNVQMGAYLDGSKSWIIHGSPSKWTVTRWSEIHPPGDKS